MLENFKKIGERIYVLENFLTQSEMNEICSVLEKTEWIQLEFENVTKTLAISKIVSDKLHKILDHEFPGQLNINTSFRRLFKGQTMGIHYDAAYDPNLEYATVVYLNPFEGGELYYRFQDITYQGKAGDLVLHGADEFCTHQVLEVKSDIRYTYVSNISKRAS
jgi:hypothetical protein